MIIENHLHSQGFAIVINLKQKLLGIPAKRRPKQLPRVRHLFTKVCLKHIKFQSKFNAVRITCGLFCPRHSSLMHEFISFA